jgi:hypothetical protein
MILHNKDKHPLNSTTSINIQLGPQTPTKANKSFLGYEEEVRMNIGKIGNHCALCREENQTTITSSTLCSVNQSVA